MGYLRVYIYIMMRIKSVSGELRKRMFVYCNERNAKAQKGAGGGRCDDHVRSSEASSMLSVYRPA